MQSKNDQIQQDQAIDINEIRKEFIHCQNELNPLYSENLKTSILTLIPSAEEIDWFIKKNNIPKKELFLFYLRNEDLFIKFIKSTFSFLLFIKTFKEEFNTVDGLLKHKPIVNHFFSFIRIGDSFESIALSFRLSDDEVKDFFSKLIHSSLNKKIIECRELITNFLNDNQPLAYQKVNKLDILTEFVNHLLYPGAVNQGRMNVCGAVCCFALYLEHRPLDCLKSVIELLKTGQSYTSLPLKANLFSEKEDQSLSQIVLTAMKHAANRTGYYPEVKFFVPYVGEAVEKFGGLTEPATICKWLGLCGFDNIEEHMIIENKNKGSPDWYHYLLSTDGIYAENHQILSTEASFKRAIDKKNQGNDLIFLLSTTFCSKMISPKAYCKPDDQFMGISVNHYVVVTSLQYIENKNSVQISFLSWGQAHTSEVDYQTFLQNYFGFISAKPKVLDPAPCLRIQ